MKRKLVYILCGATILGTLMTGCTEKKEENVEKTTIEEAQNLGTGTEEACETEETDESEEFDPVG